MVGLLPGGSEFPKMWGVHSQKIITMVVAQVSHPYRVIIIPAKKWGGLKPPNPPPVPTPMIVAEGSFAHNHELVQNNSESIVQAALSYDSRRTRIFKSNVKTSRVFCVKNQSSLGK